MYIFEGASLVYKVRWCCYCDIFYFFEQIFDNLYFFFFWNMIKLRGEYIDIDIEDYITPGGIIHILIYLVFVFYTYHIMYESCSKCWLDIVADIAIQIGEFPGILFILDSSRDI